MKVFRVLLVAAFLVALGLFLTGCESGEQKPAPTVTKKAEPKQPVLYTAQEAFTRLTGYARKWAPDAMPVHLESELNEESTGVDGKSTVWTGTFASASAGRLKTFTCSGSRLPGKSYGISGAADEPPLTPEVSALLFEPFFLKTDSDKAFTIAQEHGGANLLKKDPKQPVVYALEWDRKQHAPVWYVIYGSTLHDAKGIGVINATTGKYLRATK